MVKRGHASKPSGWRTRSTVGCEATISADTAWGYYRTTKPRRCIRTGWVKVGQHFYCSQHADKLRADHRRILARIMAIPVRDAD